MSVMIPRLETDAIRDRRDSRPLLHQKRRHGLTGRDPQKVQASEERAFLEQEERFRDEISSGQSVRNRHVISGTLTCVSITGLNQDAHVAKNAGFDTWRLMGSPEKCRRKVA